MVGVTVGDRRGVTLFVGWVAVGCPTAGSTWQALSNKTRSNRKERKRQREGKVGFKV